MDCFMIYYGGYQYKKCQNYKNLVALVTYLNENQWNDQCHRVGYFALTSRYSFAIHILTTWSCLVVLIANVSQINWLACQILGISKQALDFVRDGKSLRPRWKFSNQNIFLTTPSLENGLVQDLLRLKSLWRNKFLITFDEFHGSESLSVYFMIKNIFCVCYGRTKC